MARTAPFHGANRGSIPLGATNSKQTIWSVLNFVASGIEQPHPVLERLENQKVLQTGVGVRRECSRLSEANALVPLKDLGLQ